MSLKHKGFPKQLVKHLLWHDLPLLLTVKLDRCSCWPAFIAWSKLVYYLCAVLKYDITKLTNWWSNINIISNIIPVKQPPNKQHFPQVLRDVIKYSTTIQATGYIIRIKLKNQQEKWKKLHNDMFHVSFNGYEKNPFYMYFSKVEVLTYLKCKTLEYTCK